MGIHTGCSINVPSGWVGSSQKPCIYSNSSSVAVIALIIIQLCDLYTTKLVLVNGGVELNPVFNHFQETVCFWPLMTCAKLMFVLWASYSLSTAHRHYPLAAQVTFLILIGQGIVVIGNNILVLAALI